jgi:hypothetical protein
VWLRLTSRRSASSPIRLRAVGPVSIVRSDGEERLRVFAALSGLFAWLLYTRLFWGLHAAHATLPPCPFLFITGRPCPLCGGTRSFAEMWQGDVAAAARFHPLGPVLFVLSVAAAAGLAFLLATGRSLRWTGGQALERRAWLALVAVFLAAWLFRLAFLPLPR